MNIYPEKFSFSLSLSLSHTHYLSFSPFLKIREGSKKKPATETAERGEHCAHRQVELAKAQGKRQRQSSRNSAMHSLLAKASERGSSTDAGCSLSMEAKPLKRPTHRVYRVTSALCSVSGM